MAKKLIQVVYQVNDAALLKAAGSLKANEDAARKADAEVKKYGKDAEAAGNQAGKSFLNLGNIWKGLIAIGIVTFVGNLAKKTFELGVKQEQLNIAFTTFLGSAEKARKLLAELNKFALVTPFTPDQVNNAAKALLAFGVAGDKIIPTLKLLGDVSAGTGKDLTEMAIIFGQIKSTGRLMGQDLLQLINAGFNPLQVISEKTGKSMKLLKEEMEKGLISFDMVEKAFIDATSAGGLFFNLMEKQSKSVGGLLSTVSGNIDEILKNIFSASSGPIKNFVDQLVSMSEGFLALSESVDQKEFRLKTERVAALTEEFKAYAKAFDSVNKAAEVNDAALEKELKDLQTENDAIHAGTIIKEGQYQVNLNRIDAINLEREAIRLYLDQLIKDEEAIAAKKAATELEKQAEALKKVNAERLKGLILKEAEASKPAEEGAIETAQRGLFGFTIDEAGAALADQLKLQEDADAQILAAKGLADIAEIAAEQDKQDKIEAIKQKAFDTAVDIFGQILISNLEFKNKEEKEMTEIERQQAKRQQAVTIKKILIESALNAVKALGLPPIPGANFVAAGLAVLQGIAMSGIVKANGFKEGVIGLEGPGTGTSDSIPAYLSAGESVITAEATGRSHNLLEAINDHRIDDRILKGLKVTAGGVTVINDNKDVAKAIRDKQEPEYYEQGHFVNKIIKKGDTLKLHIRAKSFSK